MGHPDYNLDDPFTEKPTSLPSYNLDDSFTEKPTSLLSYNLDDPFTEKPTSLPSYTHSYMHISHFPAFLIFLFLLSKTSLYLIRNVHI